MKKILKKEYLILILVFITIFSIIIMTPLGDLDELWNYNFAKQIAEGNLPYKDFSIIVTPLASFVSAIFLKLLGNQLIVMRFVAALLFTGIFFSTYKIFFKLMKSKKISFIFTSIIGLMFVENFRIDYNFFAVFLILIALNLEMNLIKDYSKVKLVDLKDKKWTNIFIGILVSLAFLSKQSIGVISIGISLIYTIILITKKEEIKDVLKIIGIRILGVIIPLAIFLIYILANNLLNDFISYAILGISTFSNAITYKDLLENQELHIQILGVILPLIILFSLIYLISNIIRKKDRNVIFTIFMYSLIPVILMFPITDEVHFLAGGYILFILLSYYIYLGLRWVYRNLEINDSMKNKILTFTKYLFSMALILYFIYIASINIYSFYANENVNYEIERYKGIIIDEDLRNTIKEIDSYLLEKKEQGVKKYILDANAAAYKIPLDMYEKNYDMFLNGNFGRYGNKKIIYDIENKRKTENAVFLIRKDSLEYNWQTPMEIINYVKKNYELQGEITIYDIYS